MVNPLDPKLYEWCKSPDPNRTPSLDIQNPVQYLNVTAASIKMEIPRNIIKKHVNQNSLHKSKCVMYKLC